MAIYWSALRWLVKDCLSESLRYYLCKCSALSSISTCAVRIWPSTGYTELKNTTGDPKILFFHFPFYFIFAVLFFLTGFFGQFIFWDRIFDQFYFLDRIKTFFLSNPRSYETVEPNFGKKWPEIRASFFRQWIKRKKLAKKVPLFL